MQRNHSQPYQVLTFLYIAVIETNTYYKDTNAHDYLPCNSAHLKHCKDSLAYNLAKRITIFISNDEKVEMRIKELKTG